MVGGMGHPVGHGLESRRSPREEQGLHPGPGWPGCPKPASSSLRRGELGFRCREVILGAPRHCISQQTEAGSWGITGWGSSPGLGVRGRVSLWDAWRPPGPETVSVNVRWQGRGWTSCLSTRCKVPSCREGSGLDPASLPRCLCAGGSGHCPKPSSWPLGSSGKQAPPGRGGGATDVSLMIGPGLRAPFS